MLENAVFSVISPEGCASILWKDSSRAPDAAEALRITADDMLRFGVADAIVAGADLASNEMLAKHAPWAEALRTQYTFTAENALEILLQETGKVFTQVLEDAGVYKCTPEGRKQFLRFVEAVNAN